MRTLRTIPLLASLLGLTLFAGTAHAQWETVDTLEAPDQTAAAAEALAAEGDTLYAAGTYLDHGVSHWLVRRSTDRGLKWSAVQNDADAGTLYKSSAARAIAVAPDGAIYAGGMAISARTAARLWQIRKSTDHGQSWSIVDELGEHSFANTSVLSLAATPEGAIYAAGALQEGDNHLHWIVRRSNDAGKTWRTLDDFQPALSARAHGVATGPNGTVLVAGEARSASGYAWYARFSSDGGKTWQTADEFPGGSGVTDAIALSCAIHDDWIVVSGFNRTLSGNSIESHAITRAASILTPAIWTTIDDSGPDAEARGAGFDSSGAIYVAGTEQSWEGTQLQESRYFLKRAPSMGAAFELVDQVPLSTSTILKGGFTYGLVSDASGDLFSALGLALPPGPDRQSKESWIIRREAGK